MGFSFPSRIFSFLSSTDPQEEVWNKVFDSQKALFAPSVGCLRYATKDHSCGLSLHAVPALLRQPRLGEDKGWHVATRRRASRPTCCVGEVESRRELRPWRVPRIAACDRAGGVGPKLAFLEHRDPPARVQNRERVLPAAPLSNGSLLQSGVAGTAAALHEPCETP